MIESTAVDEIRRLIAAAEKHQSDLEPFVALHTPDVVLVNIAGRRVLGREALREAMRAGLASPMANVFTSLEIGDIRFARPGVAIVSCVKRVSDQREEPVAGDLPSTASTTFTVVRDDDGAWRIAVAQTTPVAA